MLSEAPLGPLHTEEGYRRYFMDVVLWQPYVEAICKRHHLLPCEPIRGGLPGSCPAFIVNERWVIKLFGRLFNGAGGFAAEQQANLLVAADPAIPVPRLLAHGNLFEQPDDWPWPYLIFPYVPSISIGEVYNEIRQEDREQVAREMGILLRRLHDLPLAQTPPLIASWRPYRAFLADLHESCRARHQQWGTLPPHLVDQIDRYLLPIDGFIDEHARPHLIHADLTPDHLLGRLDGDRWTTLALIDFGDARVGNLYYELVALHVDTFRQDKRLLRIFLDSYGLDAGQRRTLPHLAMSATLLFEYNDLALVFASHHSAHHIATLEEFATRLWDVDSTATLS
jgi:hygromycin-B 7''-O-kinase